MSEAFPDHPFWNYSLALYAQPGVTDACLKLQDEYGLDVNIVLFCVWAGAAGPGELTPAELNAAIARAGRWQTEVVERIRYIRRTLKQDALGANAELVAAFRPRAQALELDGEHVEQLLLASLVPVTRGPTGRVRAEANLSHYLDAAGINNADAANAALRAILARAFA